MAGTLEKTYRQHDTERARDAAKVSHRAILLRRLCQAQMPYILLDAEVRRLKELRQKNDLRATLRCFTYGVFRFGDVPRCVPIARELCRGNGHGAGDASEMSGSSHGPARYRSASLSAAGVFPAGRPGSETVPDRAPARKSIRRQGLEPARDR